MLFYRIPRAAFGLAVISCACPSLSLAQTLPENLPELVITATRHPLEASRAGSAITIVGREEIEAFGTKSLADVLRGSPGLDLREQGGPGGLLNVSLRGSSPAQTLVLIDGLRVGDASGIGGELDLSTLSAADIERIEILRGPQSALYGSDAMGGVVNIITRTGARAPRRAVALEAGSYGTVLAQGSVSGATESTRYAFTVSGFRSDGFSRYGHNIRRIESLFPGGLEADGATKISGSARISHRLGNGVAIDLGFGHYANRVMFDNPGAFTPAQKDTAFNRSRQDLTLAYARLKTNAFDGRLTNALTVFANQTNRRFRVEQSCFDALWQSYDCNQFYVSRRFGAEYQGDLRLGAYGLLVFGFKAEREEASNKEEWLPGPQPAISQFSGSQTTQSAFAIHQIQIGRTIDFSLSGRVDIVDGDNVFPTWRATAAWRPEGTGLKLRASAATGARAPSLFQRFSIYGTPNLEAEKNFGYDLGFDQHLWNGRAKLSATWFDTWYNNLIDFDFRLNGGVGGYFNVGQARIKGVELAGEAHLVPGAWRVRAAYTYLDAFDEDRQLPLLRRPRHKGSLSVLYSGLPGLQVEGRATLIGKRPDVSNEFPFGRVHLPAYVRFDARASYAVTDAMEVYGRIENIANARYEEIRDFGVTGRAFYAGVRLTW